MRDLPHLVQLQAYEAAARHLSFTRAADELNCTQAAISQRVRGLEQYFGRPLFHRRPGGLELSSAGRAYLPGITRALDMAEAATRGLTGRRAPEVVTLSAPVSFLTLWLAPRLTGFAAAHPQVQLSLNSAIWTDPNLDLADLWVTVVDGDPPAGARLLAPAPLTRVARPDSPPRRIEVAGRYALWDLWTAAGGRDDDTGGSPLRTDNAAAALALAEAGAGAAVVYTPYAAPALAAGRLEATGAPADVGHAFAALPNPRRAPGQAAGAFVDWLAAQMEEGMVRA